VKLRSGDFVSEIELNSSEAANAVKVALPIKGVAQCWQEELYFEIPVALKAEDIRLMTARVSQGDVAYWPPGRCFCVFYGKTQPVSEVAIIGEVKTGLEVFMDIREGDEIGLVNE
jgi:uncharacterized protein